MPQTPGSEISSAPEQSGTSLKKKEYKRQYHIKNRDRLIKKSKDWYDNNLDRRKAFIKEWNKKNPDKVKGYQKTYKLKLRKQVIGYYSAYKYRCACCLEEHMEFLSIDHMDGKGGEHRREIGINGGHRFYAWLIKNNFPYGYRVLCNNCNHALGIWGYCPHNKTP